MTPDLTPGELRSLVDLARARADRLGVRVATTGTVRTKHGCIGAASPNVWLRLVAKGLVAGGEGKLRLTAEGVRAVGGMG